MSFSAALKYAVADRLATELDGLRRGNQRQKAELLSRWLVSSGRLRMYSTATQLEVQAWEGRNLVGGGVVVK